VRGNEILLERIAAAIRHLLSEFVSKCRIALGQGPQDDVRVNEADQTLLSAATANRLFRALTNGWIETTTKCFRK